jgi:hypothetical protein
MTTIVTRAAKGAALTHAEVDSNFTNLNSAKLESVQSIFIEGVKVVSADYVVGATKNVMSAGPITINTGVTVTISDGGEWTIV